MMVVIFFLTYDRLRVYWLQEAISGWESPCMGCVFYDVMSGLVGAHMLVSQLLTPVLVLRLATYVQDPRRLITATTDTLFCPPTHTILAIDSFHMICMVVLIMNVCGIQKAMTCNCSDWVSLFPQQE